MLCKPHEILGVHRALPLAGPAPWDSSRSLLSGRGAVRAGPPVNTQAVRLGPFHPLATGIPDVGCDTGETGCSSRCPLGLITGGREQGHKVPALQTTPPFLAFLRRLGKEGGRGGGDRRRLCLLLENSRASPFSQLTLQWGLSVPLPVSH